MKIYKGDVGTIIKLDTGNDLNSATTTKIKWKDPDGQTGEWIADIETPAADGYISYKITNGDLNKKGTWKVQSYVEFDTDHWLGETISLKVFEEFE